MEDHPIYVEQELLRNRIVYLAGEIDTKQANYIVSSLLVLNALDKSKDIHMYISSFGGGVEAGLAIYDSMQMIDAPVATYCIGVAYSMAAWLLAAGEKGKRYATPHATIMLHQITFGTSGTTKDIVVDVQKLIDDQDLMTKILAHHTGKPFEEIKQKIQHNLWLKPEEAIEFGIIDKVLQPKKPVPKIKKEGNYGNFIK